MELMEILSRESIIAGLKANSKKQLLQSMSELASKVTGAPTRDIFTTLRERERLGSTGVGGGIAIPHGKLASLENLCGFFASLESPVAFDAVDEKPVDLVFLLLGPGSAGADYLKALARISRMLGDADLTRKLRACEESAALFALLTSAVAPHAA